MTGFSFPLKLTFTRLHCDTFLKDSFYILSCRPFPGDNVGVTTLTSVRILVSPPPLLLTHCCPCEPPPNPETEARTGGADPAGLRPGSGPLRQWSGETEAGDTGAGRSTCRRSARMTADCCRCWTCWRPASPGGGRTPAPRSSSSWWTGGPCLCCWRRRDVGFTLVSRGGRCGGVRKLTNL